MTAPRHPIELRAIDSHTGGEPTRLIVDGFPDLGNGSMAERRERFAREFDRWRQAVILEPRGNDVLVGALLCKPVSPQATAGVIFFNNAGFLNMCGHGTIGLIASLAWLGRIKPGTHLIETPVGNVSATLHEDGSVSVENVPARRGKKQLSVSTAVGTVTGDIAWGGNWFFLINDHPFTLEPAQIPQLTEYAWAVRAGLEAAGIRGDDGGEIDHIELFADADADSRSFVLCPGKPGIARRAAPEPAPNWPVWPKMASCSPANSGAGQYYRQPVYRQLYAQRRRYHSDDPRRSLGVRRYPADPQPGRSLLLGDRAVNHGDVIVIGAGIVGAACAWQLAKRGQKVILLDDRQPGATAAGMGHLVCMDDDPAELALSAWSLACWRTLTPRMPERCAWRGCGTLWLAETPRSWRLPGRSSGEWPHIRSPARCRPHTVDAARTAAACRPAGWAVGARRRYRLCP
jgi:4-hydroxyproline epimerase